MEVFLIFCSIYNNVYIFWKDIIIYINVLTWILLFLQILFFLNVIFIYPNIITKKGQKNKN